MAESARVALESSRTGRWDIFARHSHARTTAWSCRRKLKEAVDAVIIGRIAHAGSRRAPSKR